MKFRNKSNIANSHLWLDRQEVPATKTNETTKSLELRSIMKRQQYKHSWDTLLSNWRKENKMKKTNKNNNGNKSDKNTKIQFVKRNWKRRNEKRARARKRGLLARRRTEKERQRPLNRKCVGNPLWGRARARVGGQRRVTSGCLLVLSARDAKRLVDTTGVQKWRWFKGWGPRVVYRALSYHATRLARRHRWKI